MFRILLIVQLCFLVSATVLERVSVSTPQGNVNGIQHNVDNYGKVRTFKGIPYAGPPVGEYRLKKTRRPQGFRELNATHYANSCIQDPKFKYGNFEVRNKSFSEDCLYLNVYSPKNATGLPVMVWIHGGGWFVGSASQYDGRHLAAMGNVVVVTVNYRLGILGFFPNGKRESTLGIQDVAMALNWVKMAITFYGGDPEKVTLFGESAGGALISYLITSPAGVGLFKRAICQSGVARMPWNHGKSKEQKMKIIKDGFQRFGCLAEPINCIMNATTDQINAISQVIIVTSPEIDDYQVIMKDYDNMTRVPSDVEVLIGLNSNEYANDLYGYCSSYDTKSCSYESGLPSSVLRDYTGLENITEDQMKRLTDTFEKWFPGSKVDDLVSYISASALGTDFVYRLPVNSTATDLARAGRKVAVYEFNINGRYSFMPDQPWSNQAAHGDEIPFVFGWRTGVETEEEVKAAEVVVKLWTDFARYGLDSEKWYPFTTERAEFLYIDRDQPGGRLRSPLIPRERNEFWSEYQRTGYFPVIDIPITGSADRVVSRCAGVTILVAIFHFVVRE